MSFQADDSCLAMAPTLKEGFSCFSFGRLTEQKCKKAHLRE
jgi:hypothetical protein